MKIAIIFAALVLAQAMTFHDQAGRVVGHERTDSNGVTTFSDAAGRTTGRAQTDMNGVTRYYDPAGRVIGSERK